MTKELFAKAHKKIIPFEQNGEFFHRKARKYVENNNYINALSYYRRAVEKEPDNIEYLLDLAEVFTEMGYFTESNQILFGIVQKNQSRGDCYFGIGCNFLGLQEYARAEEWLEKYLDLDEDGLYSEEARDLLDVLKSQEFYLDNYDGMDSSKERALKNAAKGKDYLDKGDYKRAVRELEKVVRDEPGLVFARNNLALAYFCNGQLDKAIDTCYGILRDFPQNVHANCNAALFNYEKGDTANSDKYLKVILGLNVDDPEEMHKIAVTLCELKQHERVHQLLRSLLQYKPYDIKILHYTAIACFNMRMFKVALKYWDKIEKIAPNNTISGYYKKHTQGIMRNEQGFKELPYSFQVPYDEIIRRVKKINELLKLPNGDLAAKWKHEDSLSSLLSWGLDLNDQVIKKAILNVVASFRDKKSERFLRDFILRKNESDELIREGLTLLKQMDASEPYIAYVGDNIVEVKVNFMEQSQQDVSRVLIAIPQFAIDNMMLRYPKGYEDEIRALWDQIIEHIPPDVILRRKPEGWAAGLELYYCVVNSLKANKTMIAEIYFISYTTLMRSFNDIEKAAGEAWKRGTVK